MKEFNRIIFVGKNGNCREPMAMELLKGEALWHRVEVDARGAVVLFPEPINQKAEAVMISKGINIGNYMSSQLMEEDFADDTLILTFEQKTKESILKMFENACNVYVLTEVTGDELEILDPYGADLLTYGLCFETLVKSINKLAEVLNEGTFFTEENEPEGTKAGQEDQGAESENSIETEEE